MHCPRSTPHTKSCVAMRFTILFDWRLAELRNLVPAWYRSRIREIQREYLNNSRVFFQFHLFSLILLIFLLFSLKIFSSIPHHTCTQSMKNLKKGRLRRETQLVQFVSTRELSTLCHSLHFVVSVLTFFLFQLQDEWHNPESIGSHIPALSVPTTACFLCCGAFTGTRGIE